MSAMTHPVRRRWHQVTSTPCFTIENQSAVLAGTPTTLRRALGCRSDKVLQRQLDAGQSEGWLSTEPTLTIDLAHLDGLLTKHQALSPRAEASALKDLELLERHGIRLQRHDNGAVLIGVDNQLVTLSQLGELFAVSLGTAQYRLGKLRRLTECTPPPLAVPATDSQTHDHQEPSTVSTGSSVAERILTQLEGEADSATRQALAQALTAALQHSPTGSRTSSRQDSRTNTVREPVATIRDTQARGSLELEKEQEPIPVPIRDDSRINQNRSRTARGLNPSTQWRNIEQLEAIIRPLETKSGPLGPKARDELMKWDPDEAQHAVNALTKWVSQGFVVTNASAYMANAAREGYISLFPLSQAAAAPEVTSQWAQRARTTSPEICIDLIEATLGHNPGATYDPNVHLQALTQAAQAAPEILELYSPATPESPTTLDITTNMTGTVL